MLIEDINDNRPEFVGAPYRIRVEELTPPGLTIFRGLQALDRDKPNTANSEVTYSIIRGNERRIFSVEAASSKKAVIVLRKNLDFDTRDKQFNLTIKAEVGGGLFCIIYVVYTYVEPFKISKIMFRICIL